MAGIVKRFNFRKGFGFIRTKDGRDAFVHYSDIIMDGFKTIEVGTVVEFDPVETKRGLQAKNVRIKPIIKEVSQKEC